jgi:hypothetical protein
MFSLSDEEIALKTEELAKNAREAQGVAAVTGLQLVGLGGTLW